MGLLKKGSKLYSIAKFKCPHCNEGDFFVSHPYNLSKVGDTHDNCPVCNRRYQREPGFYYGAMYVSYGLGVAAFVTIWVASLILFPEATVFQRIGAIAAGLILFSPMMYALSKIIWANMFFKYKGVDPTPEELANSSNKAANADQEATS